jgi:hypothetical protein
MGLIDRLLGRRNAEPDITAALAEVIPHQRGDVEPDRADMLPDGSDLGWYAPQDGDSDHFMGTDGVAALHLIPHRDASGEMALHLCEDTTGQLVSPRDSRLPLAGVYVAQLRGAAFHQLGCTAGDFHPGARVRLVREPANEFDPSAVAVYDDTGQHLAAYVNNQKARLLSRLIDSGEPLEAVSIRGAGPGRPCDQVAVLAASPDVVRRLLEPRPADLPAPIRES